MPVWHKATRKWVEQDRLVVLGVTQEQHPDRCRLFAQWQRFDWPILHDPINIFESLAVPILVAIDEHGVVRSTRPKLATFEEEFLNRTFSPPDENDVAKPAIASQPNLAALRTRATKDSSPTNWRALGDALVLWGGREAVDEAIDAYSRAVASNPADGNALFRLGVCHRLRYESTDREPRDFQTAIDLWGAALVLEPNRYIWRRRIQQYGPRLIKPYPFYDWVETAAGEIAARGEQPVKLNVLPTGAEIARPSRHFAADNEQSESPDPDGRIHRDTKRLIDAEVAVVPSRVQPGESVRVHVTMRPRAGSSAHWNNESAPLKLWIDPPEGWQVERRLLKARPGDRPETTELRHLECEVKVSAAATGKQTLNAYALYYVCEDAGGQCLFLRQEIPIEIEVGP